MNSMYRTVVSFYTASVKCIIYMVYRFCRLFVSSCNFIACKFADKQQQSTGTQRGRILWKKKWLGMDESAEALTSDFLCFFDSHVKPDCVLRSNVSLYALTGEEAYFVETEETIDIYNSNVHPFFCVAQFLFANYVIKMPITEFIALAERKGDPDVPVICVSNTGRCGGTMLCQMFESVPGTLLIHEPHAPLNLCHLQERKTFNDAQYDSILRSTIRVLCKSRKGIKCICIKPYALCTVMMRDISRLMPKVRQIFMFRNSINTINSWLSVLDCEPFIFVMKSCSNSDLFSAICPYFRNLERYYYTSILSNFKLIHVPTDANTACVFAYMWSLCMLIAREAILHDRTILPVKYETLIERPTEIVRQLFNHLDIDVIHVANALISMERDSQRDSVVSRDKVSSSRFLSSADRIHVDSVLAKFSLPLLGEDFEI